MVDSARNCFQMISQSDGTIATVDGESVDFERDADFRVIAAAQACGLAKLGLGQQIAAVEMTNSDSDLRAPFHFYLYWIDCHLALGNPATAVSLAIESWHEITGKGQDFREVQTLCKLMHCLRADGRQQEVTEWAKLAKAVAERLQDPKPMLEELRAAL